MLLTLLFLFFFGERNISSGESGLNYDIKRMVSLKEYSKTHETQMTIIRPHTLSFKKGQEGR